MDKIHQIDQYYYQQELMKYLVNKEYMILQEMYVSGHLNILPTRAVLALLVVAITTTTATTFQRATAAATILPTTTTTSDSVSHFIRS